MAVQPGPAGDLNSIFEATVDSQIDALIKLSRDVWQAQVESAKQHLDAITRYEERIQRHQRKLNASVTAAEQTESQARDRLIKIHGAERVLPRWEAAGDLAPPGFRQAVRNVGSLEQPVPAPSGLVLPLQQARTPATPDRSSSEHEGGPEASISVRQPVTDKRTLADVDDDEASWNTPLWGSPGRRKRIRTSRVCYAAVDESVRAASPTRRTIPSDEVEGRHWAFKYPRVGDGYFVLLCNTDPSAAHPFDDDPLSIIRAIRHFEAKDKKCHKHVAGIPAKLTEAELIQKYGYRVEDMTDQTCKDSNQRIADERVRRPHGHKGKRLDLYETRSSQSYEKSEIQPIDRSAGSPNNEARTWYSGGEDLSRVRSDLV